MTSNTTILYGEHVKCGARMIEFGGWLMPVQYDGILAEHHRTRQDVSLFDTCHMGQFFVTGPAALKDLSRLVTADLHTLPDGRCRYGFMLNEQGGILDDLITYRFNADKWMLVVNAGTRPRDLAWVRQHLDAGCAADDPGPRRGKMDIQGPRSPDAMAHVLGVDLSALKSFGFRSVEYGGRSLLVSRTGYTGETGFEVYGRAEAIIAVWQAMIQSGVKPAGLGARDTLRLEAGLPLYGHELTEEVTPVEADFTRFAAKDEPFIGREAVGRRLEGGAPVRRIGFRLNGRQAARNGNRVWIGDVDAGWVTSGSYAPTLGYSIGMAYVPPAMSALGTPIQVDTGRARLDGVIVPLPFYRRKMLGV
jgi:aminomethyltransferase